MKRAVWCVTGMALTVLLAACATKSGASERTAGLGDRLVRSNESAAIGNLRTVCGAEVAFCSVNNTYGTFDQLGGAKPEFLLGDWSKAKSGYVFKLTATKDCFTCTAVPEKPGKTGNHSFFVDCSGVIRFSRGDAAPDASSPTIEDLTLSDVPKRATRPAPPPKKGSMQYNEGCAIGYLRTVCGAEVAFNSANNSYGTLDQLCGAKPAFLDGDWTKPKDGYVFTLTATKDCFACTATPEKPGVTGARSFFVDCSGVIRCSTGGAAPNASSTPIGTPMPETRPIQSNESAATGHLKTAGIQSNESYAIGHVRTVCGAEVAFSSANNSYGTFEQLCEAKPAFLDGDWTKPKNGYVFTLTATKDCFACTATPEKPGVTGARSFFVDCSGVVRYSTGGAAPNVSSTPIGS